MSRHARPSLRLPLTLLAVIIALDVAAWVLWAAYRLLPWLLLAAAGVVAWRRWHHRGSTPPRVVQGIVESSEVDDLRRQVTKLEADAARHDALVEHLEAVAGRPVEAVIASFEHIQRIYREDL